MRKLLVIIPALGLLASGCASVSANAPERPALVVPPAPPRIIEPVSELPPEPVADLPAPAGVPPPVTPTRTGRGSSRENAPKPEAKPAEVKPGDPKPVDQPPPLEPAPPAAPPAQLRTPQTADTSGAAKTVRTTIDTARGVLNSVNFAPLSNERKKAYNDAKLFLQQAEDALKEGNLVFADSMAKKAETLAKELAGR
jgi:hypothetical protein